MKKINCSRCGTKTEGNKIKKVADFNIKGLKSANLCGDCYKWWEELRDGKN